jgi:2-polyprenyl-6-methoxyphenol hydroxylase-like FAD-dependent oxidoreductase
LPTVDTDVLVVGAGPTGLMAGVVCVARGISAVVVDKKAGPTRESRALAVQARTMEIYDQLGLADRVLADANNAVRFQVGSGGDGLNIERLQEGQTRYPGIKIFEQSANEELLYQSLTDRGGSVLWSHRLVDLVDSTDESDGRVVALLEGSEGLVRVRARWCIGADGAASTVRRELDLRFDGVTDDSTFWVADIHDVSGLPEGAVAARFGKSMFAMAFPLGGDGHARLIALAPHPSVTQETALRAAHDDLGMSFGRVDWFSTYRVHHRVASAFRVGSVFLAGDAAHVHSPVGGQGMNTGLQDAHNLAMLIADVAQGRRDPAALDRYEQERRPVAELLVKVTDRAFGIISRRTVTASLMRNSGSRIGSWIMPRLGRSRLAARLGGYVGQYRIRYHFIAKNAAIPPWADDPVVGLRLPPVDQNNEPLRAFSWQLHTYGAVGTDRPDIPDWIDGPHAFATDPHHSLNPKRVYLIRPDGFIAASIPRQDATINTTQLNASLAHHQLVTSPR